MAKGDHNRSENKIDEQQTMAQNYLTGVQSQLGSNSGNFARNYFGPNSPSYGSVVGQGTTIPTYNWSSSPSGSGGSNSSSGFLSSGGNFDAYGEFQDAVNHLGVDPHNFRGNEPVMNSVVSYLNQQHPGQNWTSGGARAGDFLGYGNSGQGLDVLPAGDANWQNLADSTNSTAGSGGGYFGGGLFGQAEGDYNNIQGRYSDFLGSIPSMYGGFLGAASNMATTGGLSDADKAAMRQRAISPIRAQYAQGVENLDRQRAIQGGYSPGYTTALGRFNREAGQGVSDAATNAEASIAELAQKGKMAGLGAWGSGLEGESNAYLGGIGGMRGMFGTNPGMADTFGNQMLQSMNQQLTAAGHQNDLSLGIMGAENYIGANVPGNTQGTLNNLKSGMGTVSQGAGALAPWLKDKMGNSNADTNGGFVPDGNEVYGGNDGNSGDPYQSYSMPSTNPAGYNYMPAQGTYFEGGNYGLGTVPDYGQPAMDYDSSTIAPWL